MTLLPESHGINLLPPSFPKEKENKTIRTENKKIQAFVLLSKPIGERSLLMYTLVSIYPMISSCKHLCCVSDTDVVVRH